MIRTPTTSEAETATEPTEMIRINTASETENATDPVIAAESRQQSRKKDFNFIYLWINGTLCIAVAALTVSAKLIFNIYHTHLAKIYMLWVGNILPHSYNAYNDSFLLFIVHSFIQVWI